MARRAAMTRQLDALRVVERELVAELDRDRLLNTIVTRAAELFRGRGVIFLREGDRLVPAAWTPGATVTPVAIGHGMTGRCAEQRTGIVVNDYGAHPGAMPEVVRAGVRHAIAQPLLARDAVLGVVAIARGGTRAAPFTRRDLETLGRFAVPASLAVRNAMLYEAADRRRREAEELAAAARLVTERFDLVEFAERILASVRTLFVVSHAGILLREPDGDSWALVPFLFKPVGSSLEPAMRRRLMRELATEALRQFPALLDDPLITGIPDLRAALEAEEVGSALSVSMEVRERVVGVLVMGGRAGRHFSEGECTLARAFAQQAAIAIDNWHLQEARERQQQRLHVLADLARTIAASLDLKEVLQRVTEGARLLCGSDAARIALRDPASDAMVFRYWDNARYQEYDRIRVRPGQGLGGRVLETGRPARTDDWTADHAISKETQDVVQIEGAVSMLAVPIRLGGRVEGLLYVDNRTKRPFTDEDESALLDLADHAAIALENARLFTTVQAAGRRLQELSTRLLDVQEVERRRIARELHDEIGPALTAVRINLEMLADRADVSTLERVTDSRRIVDDLLGGVRRLALDLRPSSLDDLGLEAALRGYVTAQARRAGLDTLVTVGPLRAEPSAALATTCFRITQEAVTNVLRHARARRVCVDLRERADGLDLTIEDDGVGFDVAAARARAIEGTSVGLLGMEERVELAGGRFSIDSVIGRSTVVRVWLPHPRASAGPTSQHA
jgi:signal transduction histidine kinase